MNDIYNAARVQLLTAQLDWRTIPLVLTAWAGQVTFDPTHETIADILAIPRYALGRSMTITGQAVSADGTAQTDTVIIPKVPIAPNPISWLTMSWLKPTYEQSTLILFIDQAEGMPFETNGLDVVITPDWLENRGWWRP